MAPGEVALEEAVPPIREVESLGEQPSKDEGATLVSARERSYSPI